MPYTVIVLAGGRSRRMGRDKAWLDAGGRPLIARVIERLASVAAEMVVVVAPGAAPLPDLTARVVVDRVVGAGPLGGLHAGLEAARTTWSFVVACDMPFLNLDLIRYFAYLRPGYDVVLPFPTGRPEPLHAFYHQRCLAPIAASLASGERAMISFLGAVRVRAVSAAEIAYFDAEGQSFLNINTPEEWEAVRSFAGWSQGESRSALDQVSDPS